MGKTILLHADQGLGDTIQFARYAALVKRRGATTILGCQQALFPLLASCQGVDQLVAEGMSLPAFDLHAPLLSLPGVFETTLESIPADVPYLFPTPRLVEQWQERLERNKVFKIGIAWQGNPKYPGDSERSFKLSHFAALARVPGTMLISLQKGYGSEQLAEIRGDFPIVDLGGELDEASGPFMDTAAIMTSIDLVITSDTALAHLAAALGVPVWVALPFVPDWRWMLERQDSPWYPTMRLFRQAIPGDWEGVFVEIQTALRAFIEAR